MIQEFLATIEPLDLSAEEIADALWLASHLTSARRPGDYARRGEPGLAASDSSEPGAASRDGPDTEERPTEERPVTARAARHNRAVALTIPEPWRFSGTAIRVPGVPALPAALALGRALRPLQRTRRPLHSYSVDEEATAVRSAETGFLIPVVRPAPSRWLDLALVVDSGPSMALWRDLAAEFRTLLEMQGAFRDVRLWQLGGTSDSGYELRAGHDGPAVSPQQLVDTTGRRLVILLTDCIADGWRDGSMRQMLGLWAESMPVALTQTLPARLWDRTGVQFRPVRLASSRPGLPNSLLENMSTELARTVQGSVPIPVLELEARWLAPWASLVSGTADRGVPGVALFVGAGHRDERSADHAPADHETAYSAVNLVSRFRGSASLEAFRLATYLSAVSLTLPVMRLVQQGMLPDPRPAHLAEVFLGGLLVRTSPEDDQGDPDLVPYDFRPGVRDVLLRTLRRTEAIQLLDQVSELIAGRPVSAFDFQALITAPGTPGQSPFAMLSAPVLRRLGGQYADIADQLERQPDTATLSAEVAPASAIEPELPEPAAELTGHETLGVELRESFLDGTNVQVLYGRAGIGKTDVAAAFAAAFGHHYSVRSWIPAGSVGAMRATLAGLTEALGVPRSAETSRTARRVLEALCNAPPDRRCLLIFDGAPSVGAVTELLPAGAGDILITCREAPPSGTTGHPVPTLRRADSMALLLRQGDMATATAHQIAAELGDHPLALSLVAALCEKTAWTGTEILDLLPPAPAPGERVALLVLEWLAQNAPTQLATLRQYAVLGPAPIPPALAGSQGEELVSWSLARIDPAGLILATSVREIIARRLTPEEMQQAQQLAWLALSRADPIGRDERAALLPHLLHLAPQARTPEFDPAIVAGMRSALADGEAQGARDLADALLNRRDHPADDVTMTAAVNCGREAVWRLGRLREVAVPGAERLAALRTTRAPSDQLVLAALKGDVLNRRLTGDFAAARRLTEQMLSVVEQAYGPGHELSLTWAGQAAVDLRLSGAFVQARELDQAAVNEDGPGDRRNLHAVVNLALDLSGAGAHADALRLLLGARAGLEGLDELPDEEILAMLHACAVELRWTGARTEARELATEVVVEGQTVLGHRHLTTLTAAAHLAQCMRLDHMPQGGARLGAQTLDGFRATLGFSHPFTLAAQAGTAILYRAAGQLGKAAALEADALSGLRGSLGFGHPFTLCCLAGLASQRAAEGDRSTARNLWAEALTGFRTLWGPEHPYAELAAANHAQEHGEPPHELAIDLFPIR